MFTPDAVKNLIMWYEQHPVLHNTRMKDYKNKSIRRQHFLKITEEINEIIGEPSLPITVQDVQRKISEILKVKKSMTSGAGTTEIYKPTWIY